jgi:thiamine biosynthesis lipoprotein
MRRIDNLMSPYKPDSEVSRINQHAALAPVKVSEELFQLIQRANEFSKLSEGAFDITFASIGYRYDYRQHKKPSDQQIRDALSQDLIDYRNLILKNDSVQFAREGMKIDLGGIAKGYAVDQGINILKGCGIQHAIVTAGGDSRILGDRMGRNWMMGIQHPRQQAKIALTIPLSNTAISTSGDYERFFLEKNERIHHIINVKTGKSAKHSWSASVIGPEATATDALSTTVFILGAQRGLQLINSLDDYDAIVIDSKGVVHYSSGLQEPGSTG